MKDQVQPKEQPYRIDPVPNPKEQKPVDLKEKQKHNPS